MSNAMKLFMGAVIGLAAATAAMAPAAAKSDTSCYDAYGYYGYSSAYCEHSVYGRSTPADQYYGKNRDEAWRDRQVSRRLADREPYSDRISGHVTQERRDTNHEGNETIVATPDAR